MDPNKLPEPVILTKIKQSHMYITHIFLLEVICLCFYGQQVVKNTKRVFSLFFFSFITDFHVSADELIALVI